MALSRLAQVLAEGLDWSGRSGRGALAALALPAAALAVLLAMGPLVSGWSWGWEALAAVVLALLAVPLAGQAVRRLSDLGRSGGWAWLLAPAALPGRPAWAVLPALLLLLALLAAPPAQHRRPGSSAARALGLGAAAALAALLLAPLLWTTVPVASEGMKPALLPGDLLLVRRAPLALARGDVLAVRAGEGTLIARLVALAGERVALDGVPVVDGVPAAQTRDGFLTEPFGRQGPAGIMPLCGNGTVGLGAPCTTPRLVETLGGRSYAVLDAGTRASDRMSEATVPSGRLFVLGDHRDAAADSRRSPAAGGAGMVPLADVIGRVDRVLVSTAGSPWDPRAWRLRVLRPVS